ncbi:hypothetical protein [Embleya sp. AB8]|uniref:hypothetical protein n=1 Tax=Embleya sp. AB8 TaxID=3156304 RepID=UPI003C708562
MGSPGSEEKELAAAMRVAAELVLPVGLVAGGITRGRRMKRVRRMRIAASAVVVTALAGAGLVAASSTTDGASKSAPAAAGVTRGPTPPGGSVEHVPTISAPVGMEPISPQEIVRVLLATPLGGKPQEPTGGRIGSKAGEPPTRVGASATVRVVVGQAWFLLTVTVATSARPVTELPCPADTQTLVTCASFVEQGGTRGYVSQGIPVRPPVDGGTTLGPAEWSVHLVRPDGVEISVTELPLFPEGGGAGAQEPVLPGSRLKDLARMADWRIWVDPEVNRIARAQVGGFRDQSGSADPIPTGSLTGAPTVPGRVPTPDRPALRPSAGAGTTSG